MPVQEAALAAALETDADTAYGADVAAGDLRALHATLHAPDAELTKRWRPISVEDFQAAIAPQQAGLTAGERDQIRDYVAGRSSVPVHKPQIRTWLQSKFSGQVLLDLKALAENAGRPCDAFIGEGDNEIPIRVIRQVLEAVTQSFYHADQLAARQAAKELRNVVARARREVVFATVDADGRISEEFKDPDLWPNLPDTPAGRVERVRRQIRSEKNKRWAADREATPIP